jgi:hypothetical protein
MTRVFAMTLASVRDVEPFSFSDRCSGPFFSKDPYAAVTIIFRPSCSQYSPRRE